MFTSLPAILAVPDGRRSHRRTTIHTLLLAARYVLLWGMLTALPACAQDWVPDVIWDRSGLTDSARYGYNILPLGDQNNDGIADWGVMAAGRGGPTFDDFPSLELYRGGNPPSQVPYITPWSYKPAWAIRFQSSCADSSARPPNHAGRISPPQTRSGVAGTMMCPSRAIRPREPNWSTSITIP